jgi:hypothetical protein
LRSLEQFGAGADKVACPTILIIHVAYGRGVVIDGRLANWEKENWANWANWEDWADAIEVLADAPPLFGMKTGDTTERRHIALEADMRGNNERGNEGVTEADGEVYIGRASFRMTPVARPSVGTEAQITSVRTGPQPAATEVMERPQGTDASPGTQDAAAAQDVARTQDMAPPIAPESDSASNGEPPIGPQASPDTKSLDSSPFEPQAPAASTEPPAGAQPSAETETPGRSPIRSEPDAARLAEPALESRTFSDTGNLGSSLIDPEPGAPITERAASETETEIEDETEDETDDVATAAEGADSTATEISGLAVGSTATGETELLAAADTNAISMKAASHIDPAGDTRVATATPEEPVVLSLPPAPAPDPTGSATVSNEAVVDPIVTPWRPRKPSSTVWVAAASFLAGVVLTWSVTAIRGSSPAPAGQAETVKMAAPLAPSPTAAPPSGMSTTRSQAAPAAARAAAPAAVPPAASAEAQSSSPVAGASVPPPAVSTSAINPPADGGPMRARLGHAPVARATPEHGHRPWPPHAKTARPSVWTAPRANSGVSGNRDRVKIDPRSVDPFDDSAAASRPTARSAASTKGPASRAPSSSRGFVDPFGD